MPQPSEQQQTATLTPDAFAQAYVKGLHLTTKFLISKGAALDVAEEVAQGAWVRGWEARDQLHLQDRLLPWVNTIAFHCLCSDHRRSVRYTELTEVADSRSPEPVAALDAGILMNRCSPFEKALLTQRYVDGMDLKAIAVTHGLSEIAVRLRIYRCQCSLRSLIEDGLRSANRRHLPVRPGFPQVPTGGGN